MHAPHSLEIISRFKAAGQQGHISFCNSWEDAEKELGTQLKYILYGIQWLEEDAFSFLATASATAAVTSNKRRYDFGIASIWPIAIYVVAQSL